MNHSVPDKLAALGSLPNLVDKHITTSNIHVQLSHFATRNPGTPTNSIDRERIDDIAVSLTNIIQLAAADARLIKPTPSHNSAPIPRHYNWTPDCEAAQKTRNLARKKLKRAKRNNDPPSAVLPLIQDLKSSSSLLKSSIRSAKISSWQSTCDSLTSDTPAKKLWKQFHRLSGNSTNTSHALQPLSSTTGPPASHPADQAATMASHFENISSLSNVPNGANYDKPHFDSINLNRNHIPHAPHPQPCPSFLNSEISPNELLAALLKLNKQSAPGPDTITYDILSNLSDTGLSLLTQLYNLSLSLGHVPLAWRTAEIIPLPKAPNTTTPTGFRPISLLSCIGKTLEKVLLRRLLRFLDIRNLNSPNQSGFTKHRSTTLSILRVMQIIQDAWLAGDDLLYLSLDISKAFDSVWRAGLLHKLQHTIGLSGPLLSWLTSFLDDRLAFVKVRTSTSDTFPLQNSVPQGSILAATLFAIYISDLPSAVSPDHHTALYADDVNLMCRLSRTPGPDRDTQLQNIQNSLNAITSWGSKWRLFFHKLQLLVFTPHGSNSLNSDPLNVSLNLHSRTIYPTQSEPVRLLGVWLDSHLSMKYHIEKIVARTKPRIAFLRAISGTHWGADRTTLLHLYTTWIRPIIEYASTTYAIASPKVLSTLDRIQSQALRIVVGSSSTASTVALHSILQVQTLGIRRIRAAAKLHTKLQRGDLRDACVSAWSAWRTSARLPPNTHTNNIFNPLRHHRTFSPYNVILQAASVLNLPTEDTTPEPLLPHNPILRYPSPTYLHPDDTTGPFPRFGTASARTPAQQTAARTYISVTTLAYEVDLPADGLLIYTDGSANPDPEGGGGIGVLALRPSGTQAWTASQSLPRLSTSYGAELLGIQAALTNVKHTLTTTPDYTTSIVILSDCQSAVLASRQPVLNDTDSPDYWSIRATIRNLKLHLRARGVRVRFDWIPGHTGFAPNDRVDSSSKAAAARSRRQLHPDLPAPIPAPVANFFITTRTKAISDTLNMSSRTCKSLFRSTDNQKPQNNAPIYKTLHIPRRIQVAIDRLTIGDHLLNNRLHKLDPLISPNCSHCPSLDSVHHRLLDCPHYTTQRNNHISIIHNIPLLRNTPVTLRHFLGQADISIAHRTTIIHSLCSYLKASDLVTKPRQDTTLTPPDPT